MISRRSEEHTSELQSPSFLHDALPISWDQRTSRKDQINAVLGAVNGYLFGMRNARGFAFNLPEIIGLGTTAGLEMNLQDRGVNDVQRFAGFVNDFTQIGRAHV